MIYESRMLWLLMALNGIFFSIGIASGVTNDLLVSSLILKRRVLSLAAGIREMHRYCTPWDMLEDSFYKEGLGNLPSA